MKRLIGVLCALVVFLCAGTLVFAASEDVPGFVRVGIGQYGCSIYYVSFPEGFAVYEYGGGEVYLKESYPDVTRVELVISMFTTSSAKNSLFPMETHPSISWGLPTWKTGPLRKAAGPGGAD